MNDHLSLEPKLSEHVQAGDGNLELQTACYVVETAHEDTTAKTWQTAAETLYAELQRRVSWALDQRIGDDRLTQTVVKGEQDMPGDYRMVIGALCSLYAARGDVSSSSNVNSAKKALRGFLDLD